MRFIEFRMEEFGPFKDMSLSLSGGQEGLHLIYGPNEAGKSSTLRGIEQLLFGIPHRKAEATLRLGQQPRLSASLRLSTGEELGITRRKGQKETLRDANDVRMIPEAELQRFCGNIDRKIFQTMFGLSHQTLIEGGQELLRGQGEVGQLLFAAGAGLAHLRRVREELHNQAEALFLVRGKKPRINQSLDAITTVRKLVTEEGGKSQEWVELDSALRAEEARRDALVHRWAERQSQIRKWESIREAVPLAARHAELEALMRELGDVVRLPDDFRDRFRETRKDRELVRNQIEGLETELVELRTAEQSIAVNSELLLHEALIEQIHQDHGSHLKAARDRRSLADRESRLSEEVDDLLKQLRTDDPSESPLSELAVVDQAKLEKLFREHERLINLIEQKTAEVDTLSRKLMKVEREEELLGPSRDVRELSLLIVRVRRLGDVDARSAEFEDRCAKQELILRREIDTWKYWKGSIDELLLLPLPTLESIEDLEESGAGLKERRTQFDTKIQEFENRRKLLEEEIARQNRGTESPTEDELHRLRQHRDEFWKVIKRAWRDGEPPEQVEAIDQFEERIRTSDHYADRLRHEAESITHLAGLHAQLETLLKSLEEARSKRASVEDETNAIVSRWNKLWEAAAIQPAGRREMKAWIKTVLSARDSAHQLADRKRERDSFQDHCESHRQSFLRVLRDLECLEGSSGITQTLGELVETGELILREQRDRQTLRDRLQKDRRECEEELSVAQKHFDRLQNEFDAWQKAWCESVKLLRLSQSTSPAEASEVLRGYRELWSKVRDRNELSKRLAEIDRDAVEFTERVSELAAKVARDLSSLHPSDIVLRLNERLKIDRESHARRTNLEEQQVQRRTRLGEFQERRESLDAMMRLFLEEARVTLEDEVAEVMNKSDRLKQLELERSSLNQQLGRLASGQSTLEFLEAIRRVELDTVEREHAQAIEELKRIEEERDAAHRRMGDLERQLRQIDGNDRTARLAEDMQCRLAELKQDAAKYVRLKMACGVLERAIERYRRENEGPVLRRASELFRELTLGSFESLEVDYDANGQALLVGHRVGRREAVAIPAMSEGTADQLYLALRMASMELYIAQHEPLPFIVDDILVNFDDDRSVAALKVLADLSSGTQVMFFTHHRHLVELAQANLDPDVLFVHELPGPMDQSASRYDPVAAG
ncbi:AAA family ATPase [bacterium]|nr:AAA family ATPase [bacterium]